MKNPITILGSILVVVVLIGVYLFGIGSGINTPTTVGSVGADSYNSTTTDATWDVSKITTQFKLLKNGPGTLGSVIITKSVAGAINLYDGTTTSAHSDRATTTLALIQASVAAGTYTFDSAFAVGLVAEFPTALGAASSTITWK